MLVRVRVIKKIGLITRLYIVSARSICRTAKIRRDIVSVTIFKPLHLVASTSSSMRGKRPDGVMSLVKRALSNFPGRCQPVSPTLLRDSLSLENLKKTFNIELDYKSDAVKPSCPSTAKRVEWLNTFGLERPRKAFSLARDDLEAAVAF